MKKTLQMPLIRKGVGMLCLALMLFTLISGFRVSAQPTEKRMDAIFTHAPLKEVFDFLEAQTGYAVNYFKDEVNLQDKVSLHLQQATTEEILKSALQQTHYSYQLDGRMIIIRKKQETPARVNTGKVAGTLLDEKTGEPIIGATVRTGSKGTVTDVKGQYILELPTGSYTLEISSVGYNNKKITQVNITTGQVVTLDITLSLAKGTLKGVEVVGTAQRETLSALYARQRNNIALSDGISAEQIRRTPDNNVAQVLKRISGLTVQDNKFVVVRGMSERYNNVLLNGSSLPSSEPNRRNFSFDIVPSNLIDNVIVNKTATADMPGEFTGGLVQVNTIDIPRQNFILFQVGTGWNNNSTGKDFYSTRRLNSDYWGAAGDERSWFNKEWKSTGYQAAIVDNDRATINAMNAKVPNFYGLHKYTAKPMQQYQLSLGGSKEVGEGRTLGLVLAGTYRHEENIENYDAWFRSSPTIVDTAHEYQFITSIGAIGNIAYQTKKHKLVWRNIFNRRFHHDNIVQNATDKGRNGTQREYISLLETGDLFQTRLEGEHLLSKGGIKFNWFADHAKVNKEQPHTLYSQAQIEDFDEASGKQRLRWDVLRSDASNINDGGVFTYALEEKKQNIGGDFTIPFKVGELAQKIKTGYWGTFRKATYEQATLIPTTVDRAPRGIQVADSIGFGRADYEIYTPENFGAGLLYYKPVSATGVSAADYYDGTQNLHAAYLMADLQPLEKLHIIAGVRYENNMMRVHNFASFADDQSANLLDTTVTYRESDWLPSLNIIYNITPKINVRAAYSKTLARPDFRERASFVYYDLRLRQTVIGAKGLEYSRANNVDLRFEWYPSPVEILSVTVFYKKYKKPVETVNNQMADNKYSVFYFNLEDAENKGLELDYRHSFSFIKKTSNFWKNLFLSANFTIMESKVSYNEKKLRAEAQSIPYDPSMDSAATVRTRPLQGLSPYIINGGLSYQGNIIGANVTYNRIGRRVLFAGIDDYDDIYENPRDVIDLQLSARLLKQKMEIRFNVSDLLNQYYIDYFNKVPDGNPPQAPSSISNVDDPKGMGYNPDSDWKLKRTKRGTAFTFTISYRL